MPSDPTQLSNTETTRLGREVSHLQKRLDSADQLVEQISSGEARQKELEKKVKLIEDKVEEMEGHSEEATLRFAKELDDLREELRKIEKDLSQQPASLEVAKQWRHELGIELAASEKRLQLAEEKLRLALEQLEKEKAEAEAVEEEKKEVEREEELHTKEGELIDKYRMSQGGYRSPGAGGQAPPPTDDTASPPAT